MENGKDDCKNGLSEFVQNLYLYLFIYLLSVYKSPAGSIKLKTLAFTQYKHKD